MTDRLDGVGVAVTRPGRDSGRLGRLLGEVGARVYHWPTIKFAAPAEPAELEGAMGEGDVDWLVVTSPRAARWVLRNGTDVGDAARRPRTAAVGRGTAAVLSAAGWDVDRTAHRASGRGLVEMFEASGEARGARLLLPRSDRADDGLVRDLGRLGADVRAIVAYRTLLVPPDGAEIRRLAAAGLLRVVTFTSPSTVDGFMAAFDEPSGARAPAQLAAVAIGTTTSAALEGYGWPATVADRASPEGLIRAALHSIGEDARTENT